MQAIKIHKLGPVDDCQIEIKDFMVFTGSQATGKSTIAKSVFFFKNIPELLWDQVRKGQLRSLAEDEEADLSLKNKLIKNIRLNFLRTFGSTWAMDSGMYLYYRYTDDVTIKISLADDTKSPNYIWIDLSPELRVFLDKLESQEWNINTQNTVRDMIRGEFNLNTDVIYIPAGRSMLTLLSDQLGFIYGTMNDAQKRDLDYCTQNYLELILRLKSYFRQDISSMIADVRNLTTTKVDLPLLRQAQKLISEILEGRYQNVDGEERLCLPNGHYVKINFASSGQQEAVWILNVLVYYILNNKKAYFIIEEPESHLYPNVQRLITDFIALARAGQNQVLLTTHSPYILGELNNLLYAGEISDSVDKNCLNAIIPSKCWLKREDFAAYHTDGGCPQLCMDAKKEQITQEVIDGASDEINRAFDEMLKLKNGEG